MLFHMDNLLSRCDSYCDLSRRYNRNWDALMPFMKGENCDNFMKLEWLVTVIRIENVLYNFHQGDLNSLEKL